MQRHFVRKIKLNGNNFDYWDRLAHFELYSLERRRERYMIIYTWKIIESMVPNISDIESRKILAYQTKRLGRKCYVPSVVGQSVLYKHFLAVIGPKLFNVMPRSIRDLTGCTVDVFKNNLDKFLSSISDQPIIAGYTGGNNQLYGSNSLIDILS